MITGAVLDCGNFNLTPISGPDFTDFTQRLLLLACSLEKLTITFYWQLE